MNKSEGTFPSLLLCIKTAQNSILTPMRSVGQTCNPQCLCGFQAVCPIITHSSIRRTIPVAFIYLLLFSTLKCAKNPVFMRVFGIFAYAEFSPRHSPKRFKNAPKCVCVYSTEGRKTPQRTWDELLFLFFVSITLFVEIMSKISNCF